MVLCTDLLGCMYPSETSTIILNLVVVVHYTSCKINKLKNEYLSLKLENTKLLLKIEKLKFKNRLNIFNSKF